ncbi:MAG: aldose 1-epimerase family protein [Armatimonadetes bacterium]|nr:aldose 1-epimerase family protein [Armatimonadota bacterium]
MALLYGKKYTKQELLDRVGDISQIGGARQIKLAGGTHEGVEAVEFRTGSGLCFLAVPGRGLDITLAEHNGRPFAWRSAAGEVTPALFEEPGIGWLRNFPGGLVTTCGLTYAGATCEDNGEKLGLHGRFSNTAASNVWVDGEWDGDEYRMWAIGKVRELRLFGENLLLQRKISATLGENSFTIEDIVTNEGARRVPHMILYHINGGWPAVEAGSFFVAPTRSATPRDADAEVDKEHYYLNDPPTAGFKERCYYHDMAADKDGFTYAGLVNKNMPGGEQFGFCVKYNVNELPTFTQWKMNGTREYVVGLEPANCRVEGRAKERERGTLQFLKVGETRRYGLEVTVLTNAEEVGQFEELVRSLAG